jgi:FkbM family methyltransferase
VIKGFELPRERLLPLYKLELLLGTYERDTVAVCRHLIRPGAVVVDIGAHVGYFTLLFSSLVGPRGRVLAFEPDPQNVEILRRNVARRGAGNVEVVGQAVSDFDGRAKLYRTPLSMGHSLHSVKQNLDQVIVDVGTLDGVLERRGIETLRFVKIDVEGAEPDVLRGMRRLAAGAPDLVLVLEFKPALLAARGYRPAALLELLAEMGFETSAIGPGGTLAPASPSDTGTAASAYNLLARKTARLRAS